MSCVSFIYGLVFESQSTIQPDQGDNIVCLLLVLIISNSSPLTEKQAKYNQYLWKSNDRDGTFIEHKSKWFMFNERTLLWFEAKLISENYTRPYRNLKMRHNSQEFKNESAMRNSQEFSESCKNHSKQVILIPHWLFYRLL